MTENEAGPFFTKNVKKGPALFLIAVLGLALRLAFSLGYWTGQPLTRDEQEYLSLARSLAAIPLLQERRIQVKVACPLMKQNLMAYRGVMTLAERLDVPYVLDLTITPMMDGTDAPLEHRVSVDALLPVLQDSALQSCGTKIIPEDAIAPAILGSSVSSGIESSAYDDLPCSAGHNSCYVSPYGDVYACVQLPMPAGNVRKQSFREIWANAPALERIRNVREDQLPICSQCEIRSYCERCPGLAWMEGGDLLGAYERACTLAEQRARLAGAAAPVSAWRKNVSVDPGVPHGENAAARESQHAVN
jgi:radical SAM protein with 4Fe4S-binding SPASM domain